MTKCLVTKRNPGFELDNFFNGGLNNLFEDFGFRMPNLPESDFSPRVNIVDNKDNVELTFELPGIDKNEINVLVRDNVLTVSGERKMKNEVKEDGYVRSEIRNGKFSRSFNLGDNIDVEKVAADYKDGLLHIKLDKKEEAKPKEIQVKIS